MRKHLTSFVDQTNVYNHLRNVTELVKSDSSGASYIRYRGDWNDEKVGQKFGFSKYQIMEFRSEHIGKFNPGEPGKPHNRMAILKMIEALETRVTLLEDCIAPGPGNGRQQQFDGPQPF